MKSLVYSTGLLVTVLIIIVSCTEEPYTGTLTGDNYSIRSIHADGKTREKFIYNDAGKIIESQSFYFCNKYIYDSNDRLIRQDC